MAFNYSFRVAVSLAVALLAGVMWTVDVFWGAFCTALLPIALYWQQKLYRHHVRKVLFMLDAIENNDNAIHFSETENTADARLVNRALNRVAHILYNVKSETAQQEKYYELILDCVNTGILVLNDNGAVYQKNSEALRLLGLNVFTHVSQLNRVFRPFLPIAARETNCKCLSTTSEALSTCLSASATSQSVKSICASSP